MFGRLRHKLHVSWLLSWFSTAMIAGIALTNLVHFAFLADWQWLVPAGVLMFIALSKKTLAMVLLAVSAGLILGLWRGTNANFVAGDYQQFIGQTVQLRGTIADDVTHKNKEAGLKLSKVQIGQEKFSGGVWAGTTAARDMKRDDKVTLVGKLKPGFGPFAASLSYARMTQFERPAHADVARQIRDKFTAGLERALPQPQAALGIGYLTGQHNTLPDTLVQQLKLVGLIHLVIAGGYNVTILIRFARRALGRVSKYLAMVASSTILLGLTLVAGFVAPMARTAVVTGLSLAAWYYGRRIHPLVLLPVSAALTAVVSPSFVWGDVGWYLTFVAYGGLIILGPMLKQIFWGKNNVGTLKQIFVDTLSVQIVTMPILAFAFGQYSIYGLPANLLVLPLMPLAMLFAAIAGVGGMLLPVSSAHVVGWPAAQLLGYTNKVTIWLANSSGAGTYANLPRFALTFAYAALIFGCYFLWRKTNYNFRTENIVE